MANSDKQINLGIVVVSFMAQITRPTKILDSIYYAYAVSSDPEVSGRAYEYH